MRTAQELRDSGVDIVSFSFEFHDHVLPEDELHPRGNLEQLLEIDNRDHGIYD
jgi:hypothetical protein